MKKVVITGILAVCAVGCIFVWAMGSDSWAATETARDSIRKSIEELIGKYEIKIKKIDLAIENCQSKTSILAKREASAFVDHEYASKKLEVVKAELDKSKQIVLSLAKRIEDGEDIDPRRIEIVKARHAAIKERYDTTKKIIDTYKNLNDKSNKDRVDGQYTIRLLKEKRNLLVAKVDSLKAIKEIQADEEDYRTVYQEASDLLDEVTMEVDKEILFHEKMVEINNDKNSIDTELSELSKDSADVAADLRSIVE